MLSLLPGDIVFAPFPFEEDTDEKKNRPCLVLSVEANAGRFIGVKITSTHLNRYWAYRLNAGAADVSSGRIQKESWINLNRREWLNIDDCTFKIASLKADIFKEILAKISIESIL